MKAIKNIIDIVLTLVIIICVAVGGLYLFNIKPYVVLSGSMEPEIHTGSLAFIDHSAKYDDIRENDIIAFNLNGTMVTHRVVEVNAQGFVTKGDANSTVDNGIVTAENFVGKTLFSVPKVGYLVKVIQSTNGKIIFIAGIVLMFVLSIIGDNKEKPDYVKQ